MESINEEDEEDQLDNFLAGSVLDKAEAFIKDFERSFIELVPSVRGYLIA
jgi:hypothetical protein